MIKIWINSAIRFIKNPEIYKFLCVSVSAATSVYVLTIIFTSLFGIYYVISVIMSFEVTVMWAFFPLDRWIFSKNPLKSRRIFRFLKYNLFSLVGLGINVIILILLTGIGLDYTIAEAIAIVVSFSFNYSVNKKITWKN